MSVRKLHGGLQWTGVFDNGYGYSVVCHDGSYGGRVGLFEIAVVHGLREYDSPLCYATPVTGDVEGWLTFGEVQRALDRISQLPAQEDCDHRAPIWDELDLEEV